MWTTLLRDGVIGTTVRCRVNHPFRNHIDTGNLKNFQTGQRLRLHHLPAGRTRGSKELGRQPVSQRRYLTRTRNPKRPLEVISNKNLISRESYDLSDGVGFPGNRSPVPVRPILPGVVCNIPGNRFQTPGRSCRRLSRCIIPLLFQAHCLRPGSEKSDESL